MGDLSVILDYRVEKAVEKKMNEVRDKVRDKARAEGRDQIQKDIYERALNLGYSEEEARKLVYGNNKIN